MMKRAKTSTVVKHSVVLRGHKTSVSLEDEFWRGLLEIADREKTSASEMIKRIDIERTGVNLSSAIRVFVLNYLRVAPEALIVSSIGGREVNDAQPSEH